MFIKKRLLVMSLVLLSCAKEELPQKDIVEVQVKAGGRCIAEFRNEAQAYFTGEMSVEAVKAFWDCARRAVDAFERLTAGENGGSVYSPHALRRFLYRHFLEGREINDQILGALMEIKRVILSGTSSQVSREDIARLKNLIEVLREVSLELRPHVKILFANEPARREEDVRAAQSALDESVNRIGKWLEDRHEDYRLADFAQLMTSFTQWLEEGGESSETLKKVLQGIELLGPSKQLLIGGSSDSIRGDEWPTFTRSVGQIYRMIVGFRQTFTADLNAGLVRGLLPDVVADGREILMSAVLERPQSSIPLSEWDRFFNLLAESKLLPAEYSAVAMSEAFRWVVERPLRGGPGVERLSREHVEHFDTLIVPWRRLLNALDHPHRPKPPEWRRFDQMLKASIPLEWDVEGRLIHPAYGVKSWSPDNARRLVWPYVILDWIRMAYAGRDLALSEEQMTLAVHEILPRLQNFGWLLSTKMTIGTRLLREGDLFTLASNGDFKLDMAEASRYLAFIASAYRTSELWLKESAPVCPGQIGECVRIQPTRPGSDILSAMPLLKAEFSGKPPEEFAKYMRRAEETVLGGAVLGAMGTKDLLQVSMIVQYVETFLRDYDQDKSQNIDLTESLEAYQTYGPTLAKLLSKNGLPPDDVLAFFTFMMKYGDTPFAMFGGQVYFVNWKMQRNNWAFEAPRETLMSILNQLSKL